MVNVGAESEISRVASEYRAVAGMFPRISTRDAQTARVLVECLGVDSERICVSSDLANIILPEMVNATRVTRYPVGLILAGDALDGADLAETTRFIQRRSGQVALIACDTRSGRAFDSNVFRQLRWGCSSDIHRQPTVQTPPYRTGTLSQLIAPIGDCEVILSARYHGLLTAAWWGCKVAAIARSSKISALAAELGLPVLPRPLDADAMEAVMGEAATVDRGKLAALQRSAVEGVKFALPEMFGA